MSPPRELYTYPDHVCVTLHSGRVDASWSEMEAFGAIVHQVLDGQERPVCLVDLTPLAYMGSATVALIVRFWKVVQTRQGKMAVVCPNQVVLDVICLAGLDRVWTVVSTPEDARRHLGVKPPPAPPTAQEPLASSKMLWLRGLLAILGIAIVLAFGLYFFQKPQ